MIKVMIGYETLFMLANDAGNLLKSLERHNEVEITLRTKVKQETPERITDEHDLRVRADAEVQADAEFQALLDVDDDWVPACINPTS